MNNSQMKLSTNPSNSSNKQKNLNAKKLVSKSTDKKCKNTETHNKYKYCDSDANSEPEYYSDEDEEDEEDEEDDETTETNDDGNDLLEDELEEGQIKENKKVSNNDIIKYLNSSINNKKPYVNEDKLITQSKKNTENNKQEKKTSSSSSLKKTGSNDVNILFTVKEMNYDGDDDDYDEYDDDDDDYSSSDTEDEDATVSTDYTEDEEEDEDDGETICSKSSSSSSPTASKKYVIPQKKYNTRQSTKNNVNLSSKKEKQEDKRQHLTKEETQLKLEDNVKLLEQLKIAKTTFKFDLIDKFIDICEEKINDEKKKVSKKDAKKKDRNLRIYKKIIKDKNTENDVSVFKKYPMEKQLQIIKEIKKINELIRVEKPYRLTLLESDIPTIFKGSALKKISLMRYMEPGTNEYYKMKNWVDTFMRIPFGKYKELNIKHEDGIDKCHEFIDNSKKYLDSAVYGLDQAKLQIMQMIGQLITNPSSVGTSIAIHGPAGVGKTSFIKDGVSKILGLPFAFIPLGGATDSSYLEGHSYTYEGSIWGKIIQVLIDSKYMNPIIYFDELDKISDTTKGDEITNILVHLTDTTQNSEFHDKYFSDIDFDLSRCLFIFSYNDETNVNPILLDRMYKIKINGYSSKEKVIICNDYLMPKIRDQIKFTNEDLIIPNDVLSYIIENYTEKEKGVRNAKRCLEIIYSKLNLLRLMKPDSKVFEKDIRLNITFPVTITKDIVDKLIFKVEENTAYKTMYI